MYLATRPSEATNRLGNNAVVGADHFAQFFGIEPRRHGGRTDQVAEHHRQLPPLGFGGWRRRGKRFDRGRRHAALAQRRDRFEELATIADRGDADLPEILPGQLGQDLGVDAVIAKRRFVFLQPQTAKPRRNVHRALPASRRSRDRWFSLPPNTARSVRIRRSPELIPKADRPRIRGVAERKTVTPHPGPAPLPRRSRKFRKRVAEALRLPMSTATCGPSSVRLRIDGVQPVIGLEIRPRRVDNRAGDR
jgi:hypothetical protein